MPEILLTPELLRENAQGLRDGANELSSSINAIKEFVDLFESEWHGKAQQAFAKSFTEKKSVVDKFVADDLTAFIAFMRSYASDMEQADSSAATKV